MRDDEEKGGFLARWSRRKDAVRRGEAPTEPGLPEGGAADEAPSSGDDAPKPDGTAGETASVASEQRIEPSSPGKRELTEADFADVDFSALNESSDFTRFLGPRVPEAIRQKALARLWQTDPAFSTADVLHDYAEDFTDAAKAVPGIASSWKFGRGFLSDEEVAAWEALGKSPAEAETAAGGRKGGEDEGPGETAGSAEAPVEAAAMAEADRAEAAAPPTSPVVLAAAADLGTPRTPAEPPATGPMAQPAALAARPKTATT